MKVDKLIKVRLLKPIYPYRKGEICEISEKLVNWEFKKKVIRLEDEYEVSEKDNIATPQSTIPEEEIEKPSKPIAKMKKSELIEELKKRGKVEGKDFKETDTNDNLRKLLA